jgi:hypothetical protein
MILYGATRLDIQELKESQTTQSQDNRLVELANKFGKDTVLSRSYLGQTYEVILDTKGKLNFMGEKFDTPNTLYNNGIVKLWNRNLYIHFITYHRQKYL